MKLLGELVQVKVEERHTIKYVRCDCCKKKIFPCPTDIFYKDREKSVYFYIRTWHNDFGNDSVDSECEYEFCKECAKDFAGKYIEKSSGTDEMELSRLTLYNNETTIEKPSTYGRCRLEKDDYCD